MRGFVSQQLPMILTSLSRRAPLPGELFSDTMQVRWVQDLRFFRTFSARPLSRSPDCKILQFLATFHRGDQPPRSEAGSRLKQPA
jgi:hypothetical protein